MDTALKLGVPVYDALYIALALRKECKLVSLDEKLKNLKREI